MRRWCASCARRWLLLPLTELAARLSPAGMLKDMAKLTQQGQDIVNQLQTLADELGHIPTKEEFEASEMAKTVPMFRINGLLHGLDKALKHVQDPAIRDLTPDQAIQMVKDFALKNKELVTKTSWARSIREGERLPDHDQLVEVSGRTANQLEFLSHDTLAAAGYEPAGASRTRYAKPKAISSQQIEAKSKAQKLRGEHQGPQADDAAVRELEAQESAARREAGTRNGRYQDSSDKEGAENWLGGH